MIKNIIKYATTGVLALALGTSCAAPQKALYSASDKEWQPGVTETTTGYEAIACANTGISLMDRTVARMDAKQSISDFVKTDVSRTEVQSGNTTTTTTTKNSSASLYGSRVIAQEFTDNGLCVKVAVPYAGVRKN